MGVDTDAAAAVVAEPAHPRERSDVLAVFAVLWAVATLFHVWGPSGAAFGLFSDSSTLGLLQAAASVVAVAVLVRPRSIPLLAALAALGPVILWFEAPITGSHWVLASLVDLALLLALIGARGRDRLESIFVPLARWVLIGFYFFAAFAKLNHAFFTPSASCGNFYFDELAGSLGISVHSATGRRVVAPRAVRRRGDRDVDPDPAVDAAHPPRRRRRRPRVPRPDRARPDAPVLRLLVGARRAVRAVPPRRVRVAT